MVGNNLCEGRVELVALLRAPNDARWGGDISQGQTRRSGSTVSPQQCAVQTRSRCARRRLSLSAYPIMKHQGVTPPKVLLKEQRVGFVIEDRLQGDDKLIPHLVELSVHHLL